ncbi:ATP-binding protein [Methylococcus sp. ANG]|uniref:sensor histidine kinase n=1 Tax=Methylococcus sp. ANG TaxID=3231903 RepID=UPI00345A1C70
MAGSACLMLAAMYFIVWLKQRDRPACLLFSLLAASVAGMAGLEFSAMRAETPWQFGEIIWSAHPVALVLICSLVGFVRLHFDAGRTWLAYAVCGSRGLVAAVNFVLTPNLNYREITALRYIPLPGGEPVAVAVGVRSPWAALGDLSLLLTLAFVVDATLTLWRRGGRDDRRRAALLGGSFTCFVLIGAGSSSLNHAGIVHTPYLISLPFMLVVLAMAYELSADILRAAQLARRLEISESELRETQERMHLAAGAANLGLWVWDIVRDRIWSMEQGRALYGIPPAKPIDFARFIAAVHEEDREPVRAAIAKALDSGGEYESEYRILLPDGKARWLAARGRVELDGRGNPLRMRGVSIDITRRKLAEQEVQKQRSELAHLSRVTMLGELSGSLAHELNQPLTAILANAQAAQRFLEREPIDIAELREILGDIVEEDKRAGEVIHRLRLLFKKGELQYVPLDVNALVADVLKLVRSDLVNQGIGVDVELAPAQPTVLGDKVQLQQVLLNLVVNACDATAGLDSAERQIRIATEAATDRGVRLSISDRGHGIPAEDLERVFEPFVTTKSQGLGLGLSVCRTIVTAHGGTILATSDFGRGACFQVTLPRLPERTDDAAG